MPPQTPQQAYETWLVLAGLSPALREELAQIQGDSQAIAERFDGPLAFGTGGLRGIMGAGSNRLNVVTIAQASRAVGAWLAQAHAFPRCVIGYDTRHNSRLFAQTAADTLRQMGVRVYLFQDVCPTPALSFAVRYLQAAGGVMITASHNPANYNGYKVYGPDGGQITKQAADAIAEWMAQAPLAAPGQAPVHSQDGENILPVGCELLEAYEQAVLALSVLPPRRPLHVVYSPLHGAGNRPVRSVLAQVAQLSVDVVEAQEAPDGDFPTCPKPNPEYPQAMQLAMEQMVQSGADICLATDPDCDRVGVGVRTQQGAKLLSGNQVGALMLYFICECRRGQGMLPQQALAVTTIVSTPLAQAIAQDYRVELRQVLTGFKYIGQTITELEKEGQAQRFILGFEESAGYLTGTHVRDKDAVNACLIICEMAAWFLEGGKTLWQAWETLQVRYGYEQSALLHWQYPGADGRMRLQAIMQALRNARQLGDLPVERVVDYHNGIDGLPPSDVLALYLNHEGAQLRLMMRPSGTEPLLKAYMNASAPSVQQSVAALDALQSALHQWLKSV